MKSLCHRAIEWISISSSGTARATRKATHIADHGLSIDEVEDVLYDPKSRPVQSRSSKRPALIGRTATGRTIIVIYERHKEQGIVIIRPVSAYDIED